MGRGLSAILAVSADPQTEEPQLRRLALELIVPNPAQPRRDFDPDALSALAASLGERGLLQPVLVRERPDGSFELIAGERRWRAARIAGLSEIPALVGEHDDAESLELALVENMAREDLTPVEEARACAALVEELGLTQEEVGRRVGRSRVAVGNLIRLLDLPDEALELLQRGSLSEGHGRALLLAQQHDARRRLAREAAAKGWSVRTTEERARAGNPDSDLPSRTRITARASDPHPDHVRAASEIGDALEAALGVPVAVRPRRSGGYRVELDLATDEDAAELTQRLAAPARR